MSGLEALKFVQSQRKPGSGPAFARRQKLSSKISEQIHMAKAVQAGTDYQPVKVRMIRDEATGQMRRVEVPKRLKPWWWEAEDAKLLITVRYGARPMEVMEGKNAIETDSIAGVVTTLEVLRAAVDAGELDSRIDAISSLVKAGFGKAGFGTAPVVSKKATLKLPKAH